MHAVDVLTFKLPPSVTGMSQRDNAACLDSLENFLQHVLQAPVMEGLISIREQGKEIAQSNAATGDLTEVEVTRQLLRDVKNWTQVLLDEEVRRIVQLIPYLQKLLTALFVMKVKVLSVINMRKDTAEFPLTIPANATFIHHVYIQCSNVLLDNHNVLEDMSIVNLLPLVQEGIRKACFACIAWSDLLAWGLDGVDVNEVIRSVMQDNDDTTDPREGADGTDNQNNTDPTQAGDDDDEQDSEFQDLANEDKFNNDDDEQAVASDAGAGSAADQDEGDNNESLFDMSEQDERSDDAASLAPPATETSETSPAPPPPPSSSQADVKHVTNSETPSFF
jgi:hypothetical protein